MTTMICGRGRAILLAGAVVASVTAIASTGRAEERRDPRSVFGAAVSPAELTAARARGITVNSPLNSAQLNGNTANNVVTGNNNITGSFGNSGGLINVFQNTGNNTLFQASTIVNVNLQ